MTNEAKKLESIAQEIGDISRNLGLDFYPVYFEICPPEAIYTFGAYGMPVRFAHWSFGKAFFRLKMQYDLNLSRIFELVINSNPAYAFLLEGNSLIQNKLVIGHVYAHVDFFKNNIYFSRTPKDMIERMATHAQRIRDYEIKYGLNKVEMILNSVLSIQEHVDPRAHIAKKDYLDKKLNNGSHKRDRASEYEDLLKLDILVDDRDTEDENLESDDLLYYLIKFSPRLEDWERDIISIVREESLYFYPQIETKMANEGWATFWHRKIMHELDLSNAEAVDFAIMHSQVVKPSQFTLNPYYLGFKIWEHLDNKLSLDQLLEIREVENDVSFIRNYLNKDLVEELNLFNFRKIGAHWQVAETNWESVRDNLVKSLIRGGNPRIIALNNDYEGKGILYLKHVHEGIDLDVIYLEKTLSLVQFLWGKPVMIEAILDNKKVIFECNNGTVSRRHLIRM